MERELKLMKGNEAMAEAAIRAGVDGYFGYPITPQSEIMEYLMKTDSFSRSGMVTLQAESEIAAINMVYGGAGCGKKVMTSSSSPGISLKQEGISYMAGAELPCLIVNVARGGPGLGTIQPAQADYFQSVKGGGHGDYHLMVLAPASVQEMADFVELGFDLAFKYRNPVLVLSDGAIGQMMEKVYLNPQKPRSPETEPWATVGKGSRAKSNIITSVDLDPDSQERFNLKLVEKYDLIKQHEVRFEEYLCTDADYLFVAYGTSARICKKSVQIARSIGIKAGLLRPITLFPFPSAKINELAGRVKGILSVEMSAGQMVEDVALAVNGQKPVKHFGRMGGIVATPEEVVEKLKIFFTEQN
ncbi:MAG: 3-methyl-2-oxobutanoate dehydrogenase subunit VorB [Bacteroidales bacterium]|jgi:2-oxoglutarate ferredoxin oxidoreductase subunit alpha|nr:3-methyl-2-oxobutanoate dehydrogenase subunit VorB [Bacteroidales bacterium]